MRRFLSRLLVCGLILCVLFIARPHVAQRWALFLGSPADSKARLYLDPFPDQPSCESRVRLFTANDEHAFCRGRLELAFGSAADAVLAADFDRIVPTGWYCLPRFFAFNRAPQSTPRYRSTRAPRCCARSDSRGT